MNQKHDQKKKQKYLLEYKTVKKEFTGQREKGPDLLRSDEEQKRKTCGTWRGSKCENCNKQNL